MMSLLEIHATSVVRNREEGRLYYEQVFSITTLKKKITTRYTEGTLYKITLSRTFNYASLVNISLRSVFI